jgi:hypothetical protein
MQLGEFISGTLVQIAKGIEEANKQLADSSSTARVNPSGVMPSDEKFSSNIYGTTGQQYAPTGVVHLVRFDVAVIVEEGKETKGGIGIMVGSIGIGGQAKTDASASTTSRIQFGIPMQLPTAKN